jgi:hypothetical protein
MSSLGYPASGEFVRRLRTDRILSAYPFMQEAPFEYVEPDKRPEPEEFEILYRLLGGRRNPRGVLLVCGHFAVFLVAASQVTT